MKNREDFKNLLAHPSMTMGQLSALAVGGCWDNADRHSQVLSLITALKEYWKEETEAQVRELEEERDEAIKDFMPVKNRLTATQVENQGLKAQVRELVEDKQAFAKYICKQYNTLNPSTPTIIQHFERVAKGIIDMEQGK